MSTNTNQSSRRTLAADARRPGESDAQVVGELLRLGGRQRLLAGELAAEAVGAACERGSLAEGREREAARLPCAAQLGSNGVGHGLINCTSCNRPSMVDCEE